MMLKPLAYYAQAVAAVWELAFPKPDKITWLEKQELLSHHSRGARIAKLPEDAELIALVSDIYARAKKKTPKIIIYDSLRDNAMHLGNNTLAISTTKLAKADPEGLRASIAHEYGHDYQNPLSLTLKLGRGLAALALATGITNKLMPALNKTKALSSLAVTTVFVTCATAVHYLTELLWKGYRRWQEKDADSWSVKLTGSAEGMIKNLENHAATKAMNSAKKKEVEPEGIKQIWQKLNREHPDHQERIAHLRAEEAKLAGKHLL